MFERVESAAVCGRLSTNINNKKLRQGKTKEGKK